MLRSKFRSKLTFKCAKCGNLNCTSVSPPRSKSFLPPGDGESGLCWSGGKLRILQVTCECVMRERDVRAGAILLVWMRYVPYAWVMSHMNAFCPIWMRYVPYECVMSHMHELYPIWMRYVPYAWVMSHMNALCPIWMLHVPYTWVMSQRRAR